MKKLLVIVLLGMATTGFAADIPSITQPTGGERMESARQAIARGGWARAQYDLKVVVRDEPGNADAHNLLAFTYRKQMKPDFAKALEHYKTALRLDPMHKGAHEYIGEAYLALRKPELARMHLSELEMLCGNRQCEEYLDLSRAILEYREGSP